MASDSAIMVRLLRRQKDMFLFVDKKLGITKKAMSDQTGLCPTSLSDYANGKTSMSGVAILALQPVIGVRAISMLFDDNLQLVDAPEEMDHDAVCMVMQDWLSTKSAAHHPDSPGGRDIAPCEDEVLRAKATRLMVAK